MGAKRHQGGGGGRRGGGRGGGRGEVEVHGNYNNVYYGEGMAVTINHLNQGVGQINKLKQFKVKKLKKLIWQRKIENKKNGKEIPFMFLAITIMYTSVMG
ncbi:hypothetical protein QL285_044202 [Trifolium repens]|nr:hypothetical protein QL285_044202 [Trifolium repens]